MDTTTDDTLAEADQHYAALGLTRGTVKDFSEVYAAWRAAAKRHHPDSAPDGGSNEIMARINVAHSWFKKITGEQPRFFTFEQFRRPSPDAFSHWREGDEPSQSSQDNQRGQRSQTSQEEAGRTEKAESADASDDADDADAAGAWEDAPYRPNARSKTSEFIAEYMRIRGWRVTARGAIEPIAGYKTYPTYPVGEVLRDVEITDERVQAELQDYLERQANPSGAEVTKASLKRGLGSFISEAADEERAKMFERLMVPLTDEEQREANEQWSLLATTVFDDAPTVAIQGLKKIFHQVKRKALRMKITNHLMVVFYSQKGGPGKTELSLALTSVLEELRSGSTLFSDVVDKSNIELFSKPIVLLDDIDKLDDRCVGTLKSVISSEYIDRRKFFKQSMAHIRQQAVFIGTANRPIEELVSDPSGHRRFLMLTFKMLPRAQQQQAWDTVNKIKWELLWRSVGQDDPDPILPVLDFMNKKNRAAQANTPEAKLMFWIRNLDLTRPEVQVLAKGNKKKYYRVSELHPFYVHEQAGNPSLGRAPFDRVLTECCQRGVGPFARINPHSEFGRAFEPKP